MKITPIIAMLFALSTYTQPYSQQMNEAHKELENARKKINESHQRTVQRLQELEHEVRQERVNFVIRLAQFKEEDSITAEDTTQLKKIAQQTSKSALELVATLCFFDVQTFIKKFVEHESILQTDVIQATQAAQQRIEKLEQLNADENPIVAQFLQRCNAMLEFLQTLQTTK